MFSISDVDVKSVLNEEEFEDDFLGDVDVFSSSGYHTFAINRCHSQEVMDSIFQAFKNYRKKTKELVIEGPIYYDLDPKGRHYFIFYEKQRKGLYWKIRFSDNGFWVDDEYLTCSIKAIINPKLFVGEKSYIKAATEEYMEDIEKRFNEEAKKISSLLGTFEKYSLNRVDYCINFDLSELEVKDYILESREQLALNIMQLISCGDIPNDFKREYKNENQFYLKSKSVVINCYWKYADLRKNYPDCPDIEKSKDIIRFEIQFKYPKVFSEVKKFKNLQGEKINSIYRELDKNGYQEFLEDVDSDRNYDYKKIDYLLKEISRYEITKKRILRHMLSDEKCTEIIEEYFKKTIGRADYYTYKAADKILMLKCRGWEKIVRLEKTLKMITDCNGIRNVKNVLNGKELEDFRRSLRELESLGINPVTIPKEFEIKTIPNLLYNFYELQDKKRFEKEIEECKKQMVEDYLKDSPRRKNK